MPGIIRDIQKSKSLKSISKFILHKYTKIQKMKKSYLAKYAKYAPLLLMLFFFNNIYGQIGKGQIWQCNTMESSLKISTSTTLATIAVVFDTSPKIINVFVHVINRDNGTGGLTNAQINNWLSLFCSDYLAHNISIRVIG